MDSYFSIQDMAEGEYKEKGSKFIAYAMPVENEQDVYLHLAEIKSQHPKARHWCYAYRLGLTGEQHRANDDGEPSGTAGKPIFGQILSAAVSDVLIVVVRYFGGTKLGASGLIHAYKTAAGEAMQNAKLLEKVLKSSYQLTFPTAESGHVFHVLKSLELEIDEAIYGENVILPFKVRLSDEEILLQKLKALLWKCPVEQALKTETWEPFVLEKIL